MKRLDILLGGIERFFIQYTDYLSAKIILFKYNLNPKKYNNSSPRFLEMLEDCRMAVSIWEKGKTLDNYYKNSKKTA